LKSIPHSVGRRLVPEALANILQRQPKLSIQLDVLTVNQVQPYLLDGGGDAAITLFPILQEDIRSAALGSGRPVLLTPRTQEFQTADPLSPEDLQRMDWIVFEPNSVHGDLMGSILSDAGLRPARTHRVRLAETGVGLAEAGLGACIVDEFSAMAADDRAVRKTFWRTERRYEVHLHRKISSADHALIDLFAKELKQKLSALSMP
jgi:DNA-binding transcriptional LysR family regulator